MKVTLIVAISLLMLVPLAWFFAGGEKTVEIFPVYIDVAPVYMGVIPFLQPDKLRQQMEPVYSYLEKKLNRPVILTTVSDYESLARLLELKKVHIAWFSHASLEKFRGDKPWEVICRPMQYGNVIYTGQIIVNSNSKIETLKDLQGCSFAYVDRYSGSGFFFPNILFARQGIKPLDFFSQVFFTQSHKNSIEGVKSGLYDAAAVFSASLLADDQDEFKVIARTDPIPNDPFVVRGDLDAGLKKAITEAMLNMHEDPFGQKQLEILNRLRGTEKFVSEAEVQTQLNILADFMK